MKVYEDELTPEEIELHKKRGLIKSQLMGESRAESEDGKFHCTYCRDVMSRSQIHLSHIVPPTKGGATELANMVLACPTCCKGKNSRTLTEWVERLNDQLDGVHALITKQARKAEKPAA